MATRRRRRQQRRARRHRRRPRRRGPPPQPRLPRPRAQPFCLRRHPPRRGWPRGVRGTSPPRHPPRAGRRRLPLLLAVLASARARPRCLPRRRRRDVGSILDDAPSRLERVRARLPRRAPRRRQVDGGRLARRPRRCLRRRNVGSAVARRAPPRKIRRRRRAKTLRGDATESTGDDSKERAGMFVGGRPSRRARRRGGGDVDAGSRDARGTSQSGVDPVPVVPVIPVPVVPVPVFSEESSVRGRAGRVGVHGGSSSRRGVRVSDVSRGMVRCKTRARRCIASAVADAVLTRRAGARRGLRASGRFWICARGTAGRLWRWLDSRAPRHARLRGSFDFEVHCFDVDERRLRHLRAATARAGCAETVSTRTALDLRAVAHLGGGYDAVLADVPCSSTGALRRFPSLRWEIDERKTLGDGDGDRDGDIAWGWRGDESGDASGDESGDESGEARFDGDVDPNASDRANATPWRAQRRILRERRLTRRGALIAPRVPFGRGNAENARWFERWVPTSRDEADVDDADDPRSNPRRSRGDGPRRLRRRMAKTSTRLTRRRFFRTCTERTGFTSPGGRACDSEDARGDSVSDISREPVPVRRSRALVFVLIYESSPG